MATTYDKTTHTPPNAIHTPCLTDEIESVCYYTVSGIPVSIPQGGIYIRVTRYKNGQRTQEKVCISPSPCACREIEAK